MSKSKHLCGWSKGDFEVDFDKLVKVVKKPRYICSKCRRVARKDKNLCSPVKI